MNKLVIVGNGFDLAHGLQTSYKSFINYIWKNLFIKVSENNELFTELVDLDKSVKHLFLELNHSDFTSFSEILEAKKRNSPLSLVIKNHSIKVYYQDPHFNDGRKIAFKVINDFFALISIKNQNTWVDIENTYYDLLIEIVKTDGIEKETAIEKLNKDFENIKKLLSLYLKEEINIDNNLVINNIKPLFDYHFLDLKKNPKNPYFLEFPPDYRNKLIEFDNKFNNSNKLASPIHENLFLNFNYTSTIESYIYILNKKTKYFGYGHSEQIQIHGSVNDSINFGFGDEMDENYKSIELLNDNRFLENIKSFMYLDNSNYKKLLNWIESNDFQVFIFGHSCGISDRTLLNTIFEHNNCKSIKIFYYRNGEKDNFKELSQNISRHFNKKTLMRKKVVDKSLSIELPQMN